MRARLNFTTCEYTPDGSIQGQTPGTWCCSADKHKCVYSNENDDAEEVKCLHAATATNVGGMDPCRGRAKVCKMFTKDQATAKELEQDEWMRNVKKYTGGACWGGLEAPAPAPALSKSHLALVTDDADDSSAPMQPDIDETVR